MSSSEIKSDSSIMEDTATLSSTSEPQLQVKQESVKQESVTLEPESKSEEAVQGLDVDDTNEMIRLVSQEEEKFTVPKKVAMQSELIKTMVEGDSAETDIPLPNVTSTVLKKVIEYMDYHHQNLAKDIEKPIKSTNMEENVAKWDAEFIDVEQEFLFEIIVAANYMDIKPMLDLACCKVASLIKGKTPEQIRQTFNIVNDFTPEEEAQAKKDYAWAEGN